MFGGDYSKTHHFNEYFVCPGLIRFVVDFVVGGVVLDGAVTNALRLTTVDS